MDVMHKIDALPALIIGRRDDNGVQTIYFDCSPWSEIYPTMSEYRLEMSINGTRFAPLRQSYDNGLLTWTVSEQDTAVAGAGRYEITATGKDGQRKTSASATVYVDDRIPGTALGVPPDYVAPLLDRIAEIVAGAGGGNVTPEQIQQAVDSYLAENPVKVDEQDPTVPDWAKQPGKPTYTAQEVGAMPADAEVVDNEARQGVAENTEAISQLSEDMATLEQMAEENNESIERLSGEIDSLKGGGTESEIVITPTADDVLDECFINQYGKTSAAADGYHCTDYISLGKFTPGKPVTANCTIVGNCSLAFYDESENAILIVNGKNAADYGITPGIPMQEVTIIPPEGAKYIRFSANSVQVGANYNGPESLYLKGMVVVENVGSLSYLNHLANANLTNFSDFRVLVLGDSISTDYYGEYKKWVTDLIDIGFFDPDNTVNDSIHATGFVARFGNDANDFITRIEAVEDPESYDLVIIFGGINDYIQNIPMGESGGDKTTHFKPAVDYFFQYLVDNFTQARLAVLSPLHTHFAKIDNTEGRKEAEYADYIKEVAKSYCLPVLNLTDESGFCPFVKSFKDLYTLTPAGYENPDGVHPTEEYSRKYLAPMIRHFLQGLM